MTKCMAEIFKAGDRVRIVNVDGSADMSFRNFIGTIHTVVEMKSNGVVLNNVRSAKEGSTWWSYEEIELAGNLEAKTTKVLPPRFILQYELDADPFELFATEKEVRARIKQLAERPDLKRNSIKVYEIKNVRAVKLGTSIQFTK